MRFLLIVIVVCSRHPRFSQSSTGQFNLCHYIIESAEHRTVSTLISLQFLSTKHPHELLSLLTQSTFVLPYVRT